MDISSIIITFKQLCLLLKQVKEHCAIMWSIPLISPDIYLHNVRSLNKHWEDLTVDPLIVQSQVLILQETMPLSTDNFNIPGHTLIGRINSNARLPGSGTHIYARNPALCMILVILTKYQMIIQPRIFRM